MKLNNLCESKGMCKLRPLLEKLIQGGRRFSNACVLIFVWINHGLYAFVVLYSSLKGTCCVNYGCELLEERTCFGSRLDYNFTTTALVTDSKTQQEIKDNLKRWEGLKFLSRCWSVLQPLLCQVYKPRCHNSHNSSVELPCREQCLATRTPCNVVKRYNEDWPEFLKCERFPLGGCKGGSVSRNRTV